MSKRDFRGFAPPPPPRPPMIAFDRFGNIIEKGHLVMFHAGEDLIFEVVSVTPVLNPGEPSGQAVSVTIQATFPVQFRAGQPNRTFVVIGESKARLEAKAASNGKPDDLPKGDSAAPTSGPTGIVLTDSHDAPADQPVDEPTQDQQDAFDQSQAPALTCPECGWTTDDKTLQGTTCAECAVGVYPTLEE